MKDFQRNSAMGQKLSDALYFMQTRKRKMLWKKSLLRSKYSHNQQQYIILDQKDLQGIVMNFSPDQRAVHSYMALTM